jgi:hypothetical protein
MIHDGQTGNENEPVAVRSSDDDKAFTDPAVCVRVCVRGGRGGCTHQYLLSVLSDWIPFVWQKAVFGNIVMRDGSNFDSNYRGSLTDYLCCWWEARNVTMESHFLHNVTKSPRLGSGSWFRHFMGCSVHDNGVTLWQDD